jgi:hypothetical protein
VLVALVFRLVAAEFWVCFVLVLLFAGAPFSPAVGLGLGASVGFGVGLLWGFAVFRGLGVVPRRSSSLSGDGSRFRVACVVWVFGTGGGLVVLAFVGRGSEGGSVVAEVNWYSVGIGGGGKAGLPFVLCLGGDVWLRFSPWPWYWSWRARKGEVRRLSVLTDDVALSYFQDVSVLEGCLDG